MKKRMILFAVLVIFVIGIGGVFMYRHLQNLVMDGDGMENPNAVSESEGIREISDTVELVSFHWYQNAMNYDGCFTFGGYAAEQDIPDFRLYCSYMDTETGERIEIGDESDHEVCPSISLECWTELSDFLRDAELPAYRGSDPNLPDATNSNIQTAWYDGDELFINNYDGKSAHDLLKLLQDIAAEAYHEAEEEPE